MQEAHDDFESLLMFAAVLFLTTSKNELFAAQSGFEGKAGRRLLAMAVDQSDLAQGPRNRRC